MDAMDNFRRKFVECRPDRGLRAAVTRAGRPPESATIVQRVFRIMHTLKGNSSMFGFTQMEPLPHHMETMRPDASNEGDRPYRAGFDAPLGRPPRGAARASQDRRAR